jgi:hypothetical protein
MGSLTSPFRANSRIQNIRTSTISQSDRQLVELQSIPLELSYEDLMTAGIFTSKITYSAATIDKN